MKRFWKAVTIVVDADGHGVQLDGRPVRTPGRVPLAVPTRAMATLIAAEWDAVDGEIDPRAMLATGLANAAIDRIGPDPASFARGLAVYGESDLLCYRADAPPELRARQDAAWDPLLAWARHRYDVHFTIITGVMHRDQPLATIARLGEAVAGRDAFTLAAMSTLVTITGSLIGTLALVERAGDPDTLWHAACIDEAWQAERWGADSLATTATANRRADFDAACAFVMTIG